MSGVQLIAIVFGVAMLFISYMALRRRELALGEAALWMAVWLGLILVSLVPDRLRNVVGPLQVARLLDLVMIVAILFLTSLVFVLNRRVRRLEMRLVELVRRLALSGEESNRNRGQAVGEIHRDAHQTAE